MNTYILVYLSPQIPVTFRMYRIESDSEDNAYYVWLKETGIKQLPMNKLFPYSSNYPNDRYVMDIANEYPLVPSENSEIHYRTFYTGEHVIVERYLDIPKMKPQIKLDDIPKIKLTESAKEETNEEFAPNLYIIDRLQSLVLEALKENQFETAHKLIETIEAI